MKRNFTIKACSNVTSKDPTNTFYQCHKVTQFELHKGDIKSTIQDPKSQNNELQNLVLQLQQQLQQVNEAHQRDTQRLQGMLTESQAEVQQLRQLAQGTSIYPNPNPNQSFIDTVRKRQYRSGTTTGCFVGKTSFRTLVPPRARNPFPRCK